MNKRSVCVLTLSDLASDQRILKQIHTWLQMGLRVVAIGKGSGPAHFGPDFEFHSLMEESRETNENTLGSAGKFQRTSGSLEKKVWSGFLLLLGRIFPSAYVSYYWRRDGITKLKEFAAIAKCDYIHANDIDTLPVALSIASGKPVVLDAHEYGPGLFHRSWIGRHLINPYKSFLSWRYIPQVTLMTTVSNGIAQLYEKKLAIKSKVIRNIPPYQVSEHRPTDPRHIRMMHHGIPSRERQLEDMIAVVAALPENYSLTFMLTRNKNISYIKELEAMAASKAYGRVIFAPAQPYQQLISTLSEFDLGLYILDDKRNANHRYALPNKLFEFIMAGLCVAIGPSVEMAKVVQEYDCGVVADAHTPSSVAQAIARLSANDIDKYKLNSLKAAKELNAETEMQKLADIYLSFDRALQNAR